MLAARRSGSAGAVEAAAEAFRAGQQRVGAVRDRAAGLAEEATGEEYGDVNYVFPTFIVTHLPVGLVGLLIAAIFAAAMSSAAAELAALSTTTVIDFYRRYLNSAATDRHYLRVSKLATALWGVVATVFAVFAVNLGSLIEVVNQVGSYFYGSLLGVFVLAIGFPRATANGAFVGLFAGMASVALAESAVDVSFLWNNVIGTVAVVVVGLAVSRLSPPDEPPPALSPGPAP